MKYSITFKILKAQFLILIACCLFYVASSVKAATLYFSPQEETVYQNESFIISLMVDTENEEINAVEGYLKFPQNQFEIIDIGKGGSILTLWTREPFYSNQSGEIGFSGGVPNGFKGRGKLVSVTLRVLPDINKPTAAFFNFKDNSQVLLNDGLGTPAELSFREGNYRIIERPAGLPIISSRTHPDQNKWYKGTTLHLQWDLIKGAEYSYLLSYDPQDEPDEIPDRPEGELMWLGDMEYKGLEDGIYYFTLKQKLPGEGWSAAVRFRAMIDSTPPEEFQPQIAEIEGKKYLVFVSQDKTSGIEYYEVKEGKRDFKKAVSPYLLEDQSLKSKISVRAVDRAGNERLAEILPPFKIIWKDIIILLVILIGMGIILWIIKRLTEKTKEKKEKTA